MKYWIGVVSWNHVQHGLSGGFAQVCHGKMAPLRRMQQGDVLFYYSPKTDMHGGQNMQCFTAVGHVLSEQPYPFQMTPDFCPHRVDIAWLPAEHAPIRPLLPELSFIHDLQRWGYPFKRGHFEINAADAQRIAQAMNIALPTDTNTYEETTHEYDPQPQKQARLPF